MILLKMWLEHVSNFSIVSYSIGGVSGVLVDLMFFWICFMCHFPVAMYGGRSFIKSTARLVHLEKLPFLVDRSKVLRTGLDSV